MKKTKPYDRQTALNAALRLFWDKGFHATSLKDIEAALNMKPGSIYAAFKSKENLYALALKQYFDNSVAAFQRDVLDASSPFDGLLAMMAALGQAPDGDPRRSTCMLIKAVITATEDTEKVADIARRYRWQMDANMDRAFERARDLGEIAPDTDTRALSRQYQTDMTGLQIDAQMNWDEDAFAAEVRDRVARYAALRTHVPTA